MAEEPVSIADPLPVAEAPPAYNDPAYLEQRKANLSYVPLVSLLGTIGQNTWMVVTGLILAAVTAIATPGSSIGATGVNWLIGGAVGVAALGSIANYLNDRLTRSVQIPYSETRQIADARVQAQELAVALDQTMGREIRSTQQETRSNAQAIAEMQKDLKSWQERVQPTAQDASQQIH